MSAAPFADRLAQARALIARGVAPLPGHVADQMGAAGAEAGVLHDGIATVLPILDPHRGWRRLTDAAPSDDTRAYLLAALLDCASVCPHVRRGGPRPAFVRLPLRRIDCERCSRTFRRPPVVRRPTLVLGDACSGCAGSLGIAQEVAS